MEIKETLDHLQREFEFCRKIESENYADKDYETAAYYKGRGDAMKNAWHLVKRIESKN